MTVVTDEVGVRTLRLELSRYLAAVRRGREVTVTDHGRPVARLVPIEESAVRLADLIVAGGAEAAETPKGDWLPDPMDIGVGVDIDDLVRQQRQ